MDCSKNLAILPAEIIDLIRDQTNEVCLEEISKFLLNPQNTDKYFTELEPLLPEIIARWLILDDVPLVLGALGRIVPFEPHLSEYAVQYLARHQTDRKIWQNCKEEQLVETLLSLYRLCLRNHASFSSFLNPTELLFGLEHWSRPVQYLTIRLLCLYLHAADAATNEMMDKYLGRDAVNGKWESKNIDYRFLILWERRRTQDISKALIASRTSQIIKVHAAEQHKRRILRNQDLKGSIEIAGLLVPKLKHTSIPNPPRIALIEAPTSRWSLKNIAEAILQSQPVLIQGEAGSGKTLLVNHLADRLEKLDSMITLHLNEQSDAKILLGLYTSGSEPGTFVWKPGVLTTAVREGRWVLIEDLDRAPNEIISTLLPLIERNELLLPGRGEVIKAAPGFKLIATERISHRGSGRRGTDNMIGRRSWSIVHVGLLTDEELQLTISEKFPGLSRQAKSLVEVYSKVCKVAESHGFSVEVNSGSARLVTSRDLFKWCQRVSNILKSTTSFTDTELDTVFLEAVDCFAGYLPSGRAFDALTECIAQELQIAPQRRDHILLAREVRLGTRETGVKGVQIGRAFLSQDPNVRKKQPISSTFSANDHTLRVLERVASAVQNREPLLLVGETGTGKTTAVQQLAIMMGKRLLPFNLSQQSESSDLLGGFKPVDIRAIVMTVQDEFEQLFHMSFSQQDNAQFVELLAKSIGKGQWKRTCKLWRGAINEIQKQMSDDIPVKPDEGRQAKRQKVEQHQNKEKRSLDQRHIRSRWQKLSDDVSNLETRLASSSKSFAFTFVEGSIVKAVRNGDWVLLDEINLAAPDTLEALADLLNHGDSGSPPSLLLTEAGNTERVVAHPEFRVFAAMNPATDVGKRDLPLGIRSRFTEIYVEAPDRDVKSLQHIVQTYLGHNLMDKAIVSEVATLYLKIQELSEGNRLEDGAGQKPHFSLRTLTRSLTFAKDVSPLCGLRRGIYEGFNMSFLTFLDKHSESILSPLLFQHIFGKKSNAKTELSKSLRRPSDGREYVQYRHFWLRQGKFIPEQQDHYIITPFVQRNLDNLIRAVFSRRYPVLIQGPTSSGKTSMIEFLAKISGNKFVRINNHEHTDLQEYLGSYVSDSNGQLRFQEGILVEALRKGYWIVLDELNLAPSDVLEALNRLLDDNRELFIPETQETVRPHEDFMLFATQNPAGLYGGRKPLSRAFRNRFLELHFDDIPVDELCDILHQRTQIPESWSRRIVEVYKELSALRQENRLFESKSFATLRDLFRWALRKADTVEQLAVNGYMLLAERVRKAEERDKVKEIIESVISRRGPRVQIDTAALYDASNSSEIALYQQQTPSGVVWTKAMRRLYVLVAHALRNDEPVLLVGETGCGKTTVCQMLADSCGKTLHIVNAHQNTETGDLIGSHRPIRNRSGLEEELRQLLRTALPGNEHALNAKTDIKDLLSILDKNSQRIEPSLHQRMQQLGAQLLALFQWSDGSLVTAMKSGQYFLLDEISLADDSVLERLNSVLEPSRTLFLAEKGPVDSNVVAAEGFQFLATMNPGGDYGKRELSPALRNRFTEIWVPSIEDLEDVSDIVEAKLSIENSHMAGPIVDFAQWFSQSFNTSTSLSVSIRDVLACVDFVNLLHNLNEKKRLLHAVAMVYIDTLGANPAGLLSITSPSLADERQKCITQLEKIGDTDLAEHYFSVPEVSISQDHFVAGDFSLARYDSAVTAADNTFSFVAPTTKLNAMRIIRALHLPKPILIEGDPGVGKTTLVSSIAKQVGKQLVRINLSEQTDLMDLFGSDIPVEGADAGVFAWRDAPFLTALKSGAWVLLDEMNLASQSVLEGLNACLDHRGEAYIAELNRTFKRHPDFRLFAAQNPHHQGGGRKGLPASFVNRFTVVYADAFLAQDLQIICGQLYPDIAQERINSLTSFVAELDRKVRHDQSFGALGGPWEFNLRDTQRWLQLLTSKPYWSSPVFTADPHDLCDIIIRRRFRSEVDRLAVNNLFMSFQQDVNRRCFFHGLTEKLYQVGLAVLPRAPFHSPTATPAFGFSRDFLPVVEGIMLCIQQNWPVILVGIPGSCKKTIIHHIAAVVGASVVFMPMNADIDAMDLVGGFEQADNTRRVAQYSSKVTKFFQQQVISAIKTREDEFVVRAIQHLSNLASSSGSLDKAQLVEIDQFIQQLAENSSDDMIDSLLTEGKILLSLPEQAERATFEWVDGLLVQALERGDWIILDNANLCSSSVLDRLNSLLEPNGTLIINEHPLSNGEAKIVVPHKNFRVFLTMDPRHGELSRAMRNRALELYLSFDHQTCAESNAGLCLESSMYRFWQFMDSFDQSVPTSEERFVHSLEINLDHLSGCDLSLLVHFQGQISEGLLGYAPINLPSKLQTQTRISRITSPSANSLWQTWFKRVHKQIGFHKVEPDLWSLATMHPFNNILVLRSTGIAIRDYWWLGALGDAINRQDHIEHTLEQIRNNGVIHASRGSKRFATLVNNVRTYIQDQAEEISKLFHSLTNCKPDASLKQELKTLHGMQMTWMYIISRLSLEDHFHEMKIRIGLQALHVFLNTQISSFSNDRVDELARHSFSRFQEHALRKLLVTSTSSGWFMETLWAVFRPPSFPDYKAMMAYQRLESMTDEFDTLHWSASVEPTTVIQIREAFCKVAGLIREGRSEVEAASLFDGLEKALRTLRISDFDPAGSNRPFFQQEFERMSRRIDLSMACSSSTAESSQFLLSSIAVFTGTPTKYFMASVNGESSVASKVLRYIGSYAGLEVVALKPDYGQSTSLIKKVQDSKIVTLRNLALVKTELNTLGKAWASSGQLLIHDQHEELTELSERLAKSLFVVGPQSKFPLDPKTTGIVLKYLVSIKEYLADARKGSDISSRLESLALAWIWLGFTTILCYVPPAVIDPLVKKQVSNELDRERFQWWEFRLHAFRSFEQSFTGASTNLRTHLIEETIRGFGEKTPLSASCIVQRPKHSQLGEIQEEFDHVLRIVKSLMGRFERKEDLADSTTIPSLLQLANRLRERYPAYEDITHPLVGFLAILVVGLTIHGGSYPLELTATNVTEGLLDFIVTPTENTSDMQELRRLALLRSMDGLLEVSNYEQAFGIFQSMYSNWKRKIQTAQEENTKRSSLYTFRGSHADDEEVAQQDFEDLFPEDVDSKDTTNTLETSRDSSVELADLHSRILVCDGQPALSLLDYIRKSDRSDDSAVSRKTLPLLLDYIHNRHEELTKPTIKTESYHIYRDANIQEAQKLVELIRRIQARFRDLQRSWPEHATLAEVLKISSEVLDFRHVEPVIKFLTKCEKLHEAIYEWQKVASKEFSAAALYDELTSLLISWRKLELSTWLQLFDVEMQNCLDDAKSWWFVAYESIIEASEIILLSDQDLRKHVQQMMKTLEHFLDTTSIGQFSARLDLLASFSSHLEHRATTYPDLAIVHAALTNFLAYYNRFRSPVNEALQKGRSTLEKSVKEVVLLASWKDTNIDALKQSAKSSHRKLFNLVRKFRELLRRPSSSIVRLGPPDAVEPRSAHFDVPASQTSYSDEALQLYSSSVDSWDSVPTRFKNVTATVKLMTKLSSKSQDAHDGSAFLSQFRTNLTESIEELRKATPERLTDETKDTVKHLKTRKRALFADVLKAMRQMGFQFNLSSDTLASQDSLIKVLANLRAVYPSLETLTAADHSLHKLLSLMPQVRDVVREHSGDLTSAEVNRSIGYLEALLHRTLSQRENLARYAPELAQLQAHLAVINNLYKPAPHQLQPVAGRSLTEVIKRHVRRLAQSSSAFAQLLTAQDALGDLHAKDVISGLQEWSAKFNKMVDQIEGLPKFPNYISSSGEKALLHFGVQDLIVEFWRFIGDWIKCHPKVAPALEQLLAFAQLPPQAIYKDRPDRLPLNTADIQQDLFSTTDALLSAIQDVEESNIGLPGSSEEPSWLLAEDKQRETALRSLRLKEIDSRLSSILNKLHWLSTADIQAAAYLLTGLSPIFHQFCAIATSSIQKYASLHNLTAHLAFTLAQVFVNLGKNGFCTPPEKSAGGEAGTEKLEGGTGLGEGEGAEDISKDIGDDEDLTELAEQEQDKNERKDFEDEQDAVDMADADLQGQEKEVSEEDGEDKDKNSDDEGEDDIDEEVGDVDDLGPSTVDEKMWDSGQQEDDKKEKESKQEGGTRGEENVAAEQDGEQNEEQDGEEAEQEAPPDENEDISTEKPEQADQHLETGENLELPEEMNIDGQSQTGSMDDAMDELEDLENSETGENEEQDEDHKSVTSEDDQTGVDTNQDASETQETTEEQPDDEGMDVNEGERDEHGEEDLPPDEAQDPGLTTHDNDNTADDTAPSDQKGSGLDADDNKMENDDFAAKAKNDQGGETENTGQAAESSGERGAEEASTMDAVGRAEEDRQTSDQAFKKIGDVLEKWYNQQKSIQAPPEEARETKPQEDVDMTDVDFEHLPDDEAAADTQALGVATQDQATALDTDNAVPVDEQKPAQPFDDEMDVDQDQTEEVNARAETTDALNQSTGQPNSFIGQQTTRPDVEMEASKDLADNEETEDVDVDLASIKIGSPTNAPEQSLETARVLWAQHELSTRTLSATLAEQLRLILAPTLATKLRGDFRTGKRLNIKRIIPYIASSYKRDKIWMRRSVPSKRSYQIMIALDDSKSMADAREEQNNKVDLAFQTLALIAKSLSVLEAGDLCFLGFGQHIKVAHSFGTPFTDDAGAKVFQAFSFEQEKTDVRTMIKEAIDLFRTARSTSHGPTADLWQLMLIISDGVCEDHDTITRLVRQAQDERIMIVFVIVDQMNSDAKTQSIMDLQTAEFTADEEGEMRLARRKYMDTFPFRWWLVVRDVRELPVVLAAALRQWFSEVVDTA